MVQKTKCRLKTAGTPVVSVGGVAQMVERSLSMREVPGSIPGISNNTFFNQIHHFLLSETLPKTSFAGEHFRVSIPCSRDVYERLEGSE